MKQETKMAISIHSVIDGEQKDDTTLACMGVLRQVSGALSLSYKEDQDGGKVFTTIHFKPGSSIILIKKRGLIQSEMTFNSEQSCQTKYTCGPYDFDLLIQTSYAKASMTDEGGSISLIYSRTIGGDTAKVTFTLKAQPLLEDPNDAII